MIKKLRVRKNEEFSKIIAKRQSLANKYFVLYFAKKEKDMARIGISVSKKLGNAVIRNKIKRQIRMMIANFFDFENSPYDFIIIARKALLDNDFLDEQIELEKLIKKAIIK